MVLLWFFTAVGTLMLFYKTVEKRNDESMPYVKYLSYLCLAVLGWVCVQLIIQLVFNEKIIFFFHEFKYVFIIAIGGLFCTFVYNLSENKPVESWKRVSFLFVYVTFLALIATNPFHHFFRYELTYVQTHMNSVETDNNWLYTVVVIFNYVMVVIGVIRLLKYHLRIPTMYKERTRMILVGVSVSIGANLFYQLTQASWNFSLDLTPFSFFLISILFYYSIFVYQHNEISKLVEDIVQEDKDLGIMFLDFQNKIYYVNEKCEEIIDAKGNEIIQQQVNELQGLFGETIRESIRTKEKVLYRFASKKIYVYEVKAKEVFEGNKGCVGTVITFDDITEREIERLVQQNHNISL